MSSEDAKRIYNAFRADAPVINGRPVDANGDVLVDLEHLPDGGSGWFAIVNNIEQLAAPPVDAHLPYRMPITQFEERRTPDGELIIEGPDERPDHLTIRPRVADDLCAPSFGLVGFNNAVLARICGLTLDAVNERMAPEDADAALFLTVAADGTLASDACAEIYAAGGGQQAIIMPEDRALQLGPAHAFRDAWESASIAALTTFVDDYALVRCRTHGAGTLKVGPLRSKHLRVYQAVATQRTEWDGRIEALSLATGRAVRLMRVEDANALWAAFADLKKKVEDRAVSIAKSMLSATSSTGNPQTSTT